MEDITAKLEHIQASVNNIEVALLGNMDRSQKGLLAEYEQLRKEVDEIKPAYAFYKNAKVIVGAIAVTIPVIFELGKFVLTSILSSK